MRPETGDNRPDTQTPAYRIRLLADAPAESDEFAAKAHEHVADAIAELVVREPGGKVVGLEGLWGSGKSTVVRLMRKRLANGDLSTEDLTRVVVFDAWAHQGDPLRRTFLEAVIREVADAGWLDGALAKAASDELAGRTSKITTTSTSRLSTEGKLAAGATVLLALGAALFANHFSHYHRLAIALGGILLIAPLLVVFGLWVAKRVGQRLGDGNRLAALNPSSFFANDQTTETVTEGVQRGEPTSVEFERIFSRVLTAALSAPRRLLLVLDNLDRVEEDDARKILATMQTFTGTTHVREDWASHVWTLIPYDAGGLENLWAVAASSEAASTAEAEAAGAPTLASAFLDKLFEVRFETPPLVLSDWRSYITRLLEEAFPDEEEATLRAVLRLRSLYAGAVPGGAVAAEAPTPRQLKQFVNQIGAIRRQRDDVPIVHIAYYVLLRRDSMNVPADLITGTVPHTKLTHIFGAGVREDLAALHFGADRELAQQLLLGPALEDAFATGEPGVLEGLGERPGFMDALEKIDFPAKAADGGIELTRALAVLSRAGLLTIEAVSAWATAVLDPLARQTAQWRLQARDSGIGLAILMNRVSGGDDTRLTKLLSRVAPSPVEADTEGHGQLEGIAGLLDELTDLGRASDSVQLTVEVPPTRLVDSLAYLHEQTQRPRGSRILKLAAEPADVATALVEAASVNRIAEARGALDMLLLHPQRVWLEELAAGALGWLRANEPAGEEQLALLLEWLDRARKSLNAESVLGTAGDDGTLMHVVAVASANGWHSEAGAASMLHLVVRPELPEPAPSRQAPTGVATVRQALSGLSPVELVAAQLEWLKQHKREAFEVVFAVGKGAAQPWVDQQMRALSDANALVTSPAQFLANWEYLRTVLGPDRFVRHTRQLLDREASRQRILTGLKDPQLALDSLSAADGEEVTPYLGEVQKAAATILRSASAADWETALMSTETQPLLSLAVRLSGTKAAPRNPTGLQDALHADFQALAAEGEAWHPDGATFAKLTRLLGGPARRVLASQLCAELEGRDGQVGPQLFPTYGEFLAGETGFRSHPKLPNVVERFVARGHWPVVAWFVELAEREEDVLNETGRRDEMNHLREAVAERLRATGNEAPEELKKLGALLGVQAEATES
jgi:KAP family P-loop domain